MNQQSKEKIKNQHFSNKTKSLIKTHKIKLPLKDISITKSLRESKWNNRFIYNKIPNYDSFKDKNVFYNRKFKTFNIYKKIYPYLNTKSPRNNSLSQINNDNSVIKKEKYNRPTLSSNKKTIYAKDKNFSFISKNSFSPLAKHCIDIDNPSLIYLKKLWDELEVLKPYRNFFNYIYKELDSEYKEELYQKEIQELNKVKINIKTLKYHIALRRELIQEIKNLNEQLGKELMNKNNNSKELLLNEISNKIINLREQTIKVCQSMKKLKESLFTINNLGKYDLDLLSKKFQFDKNYIIKMKSELNFLREGFSKYYFNIENDQTPFLLKASDKSKINKEDYFIRVIPLNDELKNEIIDCIFYIHQELIAYQSINLNRKNFRCISPIKLKVGKIKKTNEDISSSYYDKENLSERDKTVKINGIDNNNLSYQGIESYNKTKDDDFEKKRKANGYNTSFYFHNKLKKNVQDKIKSLIEEDTYENAKKKENYEKDQSYINIGSESKNYFDKNQSSIIINEKKNQNDSSEINIKSPFKPTEDDKIKSNNKIIENQILNS